MLNRLSIQEEIQSSCQEERADSLLSEFPTAFEEGIYYLDLKTDADSKEQPLELYNKPIKKIRLMLTMRSHCLEEIEVGNKPERNIEACLYINYLDGTKQTKTVIKEKKESLVALFKKLGAEPEIFLAEFNQTPIDWKSESVNDFYKDRPALIYDALHQTIIKTIVKVAERDNFSQFNLIDAGCGNGKLLTLMEESLKEEKQIAKANLVGFDYNFNNIYDSNTDYHGHCQFFLGSSLHIDKIITNCFDQKIFNKDFPTFLCMSGSITRHVLNNAFEAVIILQKAALNHVDYLIGGGQTIPLFNEFMAKRIGYTKIDIFASGKHFFLFRRLSLTEILENKIKKIKNRNYLDLSLSPNPEEILKILHERGFIKDDLIIDLSFCEMTQSLITQLQELAKKFKELKLVGWHWDITFLETLNKMNDLFKKIDTQLIEQECYLMAPRSFFLALHEKELFKSSKQSYTEKEQEQYLETLLKMDDIKSIEILLKAWPIEKAWEKARGMWSYQIACALFQKKPSLAEDFYIIPEPHFLSFYKLLLDAKVEIATHCALLKHYRGNFIKILKLLEEAKINLNPKLLEEAKINPNLIKDDDGNTLLHLMARNDQNSESIEQFIKVNPEFFHRKNNDGATILHHAAQYNNRKLIETISKIDTNFIKQLDNQGRTVVHYALKDLQHMQFNMLPTLDECGADLFALDKSGDSALAILLKGNNSSRGEHHFDRNPIHEVLFYYKNKFGVDCLNQKNTSGKTLALIAMENFDDQAVLTLHQIGATVSQVFDPENIAAAIEKNFFSALIFLTKVFSKIDPQYLNDETKAGISIVKLAIRYFEDRDGYSYPLELLLKTGINLNIPDMKGNTPAHTLAKNIKIDEDVIKTLIEHKLDLTVQNKKGNTPLHYACKNKNITAIEFIIKLDWKLLFIQNSSGEYPLQNASKQTLEYIKETLDNLIEKMDSNAKDSLRTNLKIMSEAIMKISSSKSTELKLFGSEKLTSNKDAIDVIERILGSDRFSKQVTFLFEERR